MTQPDQFSFLDDDPTPEKDRPESYDEPPGPNNLTNHKMKPKDMANDIFSVYKDLGGTTWLFSMASVYPKQFLKMLEKMLPKDINLAVDSDIKVLIADTINLGHSQLKPPPKIITDGEDHG